MENGIKWKNIFYFLCYAVEDLKYLEDSFVDYENVESTNDLLSVLMYKTFNIAKRNGVISKYSSEEILTDKPSGKINISKSVRTGAYAYGKMYCKVNRNNIDNVYNQVIKASINVLLSCDRNSIDKISKKNKLELHKCLNALEGVSNKSISLSTFNGLGNIPEWYKPVMIVCKLIINQFIARDAGGKRLLSINDTNRLSYIYQHFLLNFLKSELRDCKVSSPSFKDGACRLDVCIEDDKSGRVLILDAKWYNNIVNEMSQLAQVNMYIDVYKDEKTEYTDVNALVLFAHTDRDEILRQMILKDKQTGAEKTITARTLPVNIEFNAIKERILDIVTEYISV